MEDLLGGREVADDLEESAPSLFSEPEREKLAADLDGADADAAVDATRSAFGRYKEAKGASGKTPEHKPDRHRPFRDAEELTSEIKSPAYKSTPEKRDEVQFRAGLRPVLQSNRAGALGQLGDDLRAKGAPPITPVRHEPDADTDERHALAGPIGQAIKEGFRQGARRLMASPLFDSLKPLPRRHRSRPLRSHRTLALSRSLLDRS